MYKDILDIIQDCIDELESTDKEGFDNKKRVLGIYRKVYDRKNYVDDCFEILFEKEI